MKWIPLVLCLSACNTASLPPTIAPSRPPNIPLHVGVVGMWGGSIPASEMTHLAAWTPTIRVPIASATEATAALDQAAGHVSVLLLVQTLDDALVTAIAPICGRAQAVELGNELNFTDPAADFGAFVTRSRTTLRGAGFTGDIISGGVGNIDAGTLVWLQNAMAGWPADVIVGWHAYSGWQTQIPNLLGVAHGRQIAMTEWGYTQPTVTSEAGIAVTAASDLVAFYQSGNLYAIWYQLHDGTTPDQLFGLVTLDGRWRPVEQSLISSQSHE